MCVAPRCEDSAIGFATFLWRGVIVLPLCHDHGVAAGQRDTVPMGAQRQQVSSDIAALPAKVIRNGAVGQRDALSSWTMWRRHCG